jgi:hypothetical protein
MTFQVGFQSKTCPTHVAQEGTFLIMHHSFVLVAVGSEIAKHEADGTV